MALELFIRLTVIHQLIQKDLRDVSKNVQSVSFDSPLTQILCPEIDKKCTRFMLIFNDILFIFYTAILYPFVFVRRSLSPFTLVTRYDFSFPFVLLIWLTILIIPSPSHRSSKISDDDDADSFVITIHSDFSYLVPLSSLCYVLTCVSIYFRCNKIVSCSCVLTLPTKLALKSIEISYLVNTVCVLICPLLQDQCLSFKDLFHC